MNLLAYITHKLGSLEAGRSRKGQASKREAGLLTGRLGLLQKVQASHREAEPLKGKPGLSQEGWAFHMEAGPLKE